MFPAGSRREIPSESLKVDPEKPPEMLPFFIPFRVIDYMNYTANTVFSAEQAEAIKKPKNMKEETS